MAETSAKLNVETDASLSPRRVCDRTVFPQDQRAGRDANAGGYPHDDIVDLFTDNFTKRGNILFIYDAGSKAPFYFELVFININCFKTLHGHKQYKHKEQGETGSGYQYIDLHIAVRKRMLKDIERNNRHHRTQDQDQNPLPVVEFSF
jgi:hypothetical protein